MASDKQIAANRRNSLKSTGPTSVAGKAASSMNALKTGLRAKSLIIPGESAKDLQQLIDEYYAAYQPATPAARGLVDDLIRSEWTLRRLDTSEASLWQLPERRELPPRPQSPPPGQSRLPKHEDPRRHPAPHRLHPPRTRPRPPTTPRTGRQTALHSPPQLPNPPQSIQSLPAKLASFVHLPQTLARSPSQIPSRTLIPPPRRRHLQ